MTVTLPVPSPVPVLEKPKPLTKRAADLTLPDLRALIERPSWLDTNRLFVQGNHWQDGAGWIGPRPMGGEEGAQEVLAEIARGFTSRNVVAEIIERHVSAVLGREPAWTFTPRRALKEDEEPNEQEARSIDEAEVFLTTWWDERDLNGWLQRAITTLLWASRAPFRLYVPTGLLAEERRRNGDGAEDVQRVVRASSIDQALGVIFPDHPDVESATVATNDDTKRPVGIFLYERQGREHAELTFLDESTVDTNGVRRTVIRSLAGDGSSEVVHDLGGRITMMELRRPLFITTQIQQGQRALNLALSMIPRNVVTGGFLERVIMNAQMPGEWEDVTDENGQPTGEKRFKPDPYHTGAGTTNFLSGIEYTDAEGKTHLASPSVAWREPVDVSSSEKAKRAHYQDILEEADQAHVLIAGDATASGVSREQARMDFLWSLMLTVPRVNALGRWLLETALAMAETFIGKPGQYTKPLRATFVCRVDAGPLSADERRMIVESADKGYIARETAMSMLGVEDVDAELAKIAEQTGSMLDLSKKQAEALSAWTTAGISLEVAAKLIGLSDEQLKLLMADVKQQREDARGDGDPDLNNDPEDPEDRTDGE